MDLIFNDKIVMGTPAFSSIARLQNEVLVCKDDIINLTLLSSGRIGLSFVFLLGCLPYIARDYGKCLYISAGSEIYNRMKLISIIEHFQEPEKTQRGFRHIKTDKDIFELVPEIIDECPTTFAPELAAILTSRIGEMYRNAFNHSQTSVILGGKFFKFRKNKFCFSCYDAGIGLTNRVIEYHKNNFGKNVSHTDAIKWALTDGRSTKREENPEVSRGLGLGLLKSFAAQNKGTIRICSGRILYTFSNNREKYLKLSENFIGTLFEMDIIADNHLYVVRKER